ncbi:MAG: DUF1156 domain-containing protein [Vulcanisaeta sp.]
MSKHFIEGDEFPISEVNEYSGSEKQGGGRPPIWEMAFWWTRKPLTGARAVVAAEPILPRPIMHTEAIAATDL